MQRGPAFSAKATNPTFSGSDRERQQEKQRRHADGDEAAFQNVGPHVVQIEKLVEPDPRHQVQAAVEKCVEAEHAPEADEPGLSCDLAQGRDGERDEEEDQRPLAGGMSDDLDGIGAERRVETLPEEHEQRGEAEREDEDLKARDVRVLQFVSGAFKCRSLARRARS